MENKYFKIRLKDEILNKTWHDSIIIKHIRTGCEIKIQETIMGCGIAQIHGISNVYLFTTEELEELKDILTNQITNLNKVLKSTYLCMSVGLLIGTLGHYYTINHYSSNESIIKELGFIELSNYSNWRHNTLGNEIQKLYGLKTNYNDVINKGT